MAYVAAKSLAQAGYEVYVCDASPINMTRFSRVVRGFDLTPNPFKDPAGYVECLAHIVKQRKIDLLLPGHEDVVSIQAHADCLPPGLVVAAPSHQALSVTTDKLHIMRVAERAGVAAPKTLEILDFDALADGASQLGFPLLVKTRRGSGGRGVHLVTSRDEMMAEYKRLVAKYHWPRERWPVLQEYIADGQLFGACFLAKEGRIEACFTERYLRCKQDAFGTSVLRERCDWPLLADAAAKIVRELNWTGIGQLDFIANAEMTEAYLLEMNPRWWGALNLAVVNGFDFPRGLVTMLLDGEAVPSAFREVVPSRKSLWIAGELMACRAELMQGKLHSPFTSLWRILFPGRDCAYDDFSWRDPLPLAFEIAHYFERFVRARSETAQGSADLTR